MAANDLLLRLAKVKRTGRCRWQACCPAHDDKWPSLSVRELDDGRVLLHCFGGCPANEVLHAVGLSFDDLFPKRLGGPKGLRRERQPFAAIEALRCVAFEALIVVAAGAMLLHGTAFDSEDRARLTLAVQRIHQALDVVEGNTHG